MILKNLCLTMAVILSQSSFAFAGESLRIVPPVVPPILSFDPETKTATGYLYQYWMEHIDQKSDLKTIWMEPIPADRILKQMNERKIDMGISAKNLSRFPEDQVEYSPTPIYQANQLIIGRSKWPHSQEKTVLVSADTLLPPELVNDSRYKIVKIYGLDQTTRIVDLLEQERAWGYYSPVHWVGTLELLKRKQLSKFSPYHLDGKPQRDFYVFAFKRVPPKIRKIVFNSLPLAQVQKHIDQSLKNSCQAIDRRSCSEFLNKLK